ncbi:MAG: hypothetical protein B6A08_00350 [Sorangiineae bacterium NIC37A_2]|jgi:hypothetical protein|nr:MAG: hypothetical protein B6A08_00350 [Sorangiineae bacterium NIC37A_2]
MKRTIVGLLVSSVILGPVACSGSDEEEDGLIVGGDNDGGDDLVGTGSRPGQGGPGKEQDGGKVDLTPEDLEAIENAECTGWQGEGESIPAILELVVDVSRSMLDPAPGAGRGTSKWDVTRDALKNAIDSLPNSIAVGLLLYPNVSRRSGSGSDLSCIDTRKMVSIEQLGPSGSPQRTALDDAIDDATIDQYTPTHDAYSYALNEGLEPYGGEGQKFMLLITDGAPTQPLECGSTDVNGVPTDPIIETVKEAAANGIKTFVIGSPGSEESASGEDMRPWLSRAASEGGTAADGCSDSGPVYCHMDMTAEENFAQALVAGLGKIAGQVVTECTYDFPSPPSGQTIDPYLTNVILRWSDGTASLLIRDDKDPEDCTEGWRLTDDNKIELCGTSCDQAKADKGASVSLSFGCSVDDIPITK